MFLFSSFIFDLLILFYRFVYFLAEFHRSDDQWPHEFECFSCTEQRSGWFNAFLLRLAHLDVSFSCLGFFSDKLTKETFWNDICVFFHNCRHTCNVYCVIISFTDLISNAFIALYLCSTLIEVKMSRAYEIISHHSSDMMIIVNKSHWTQLQSDWYFNREPVNIYWH